MKPLLKIIDAVSEWVGKAVSFLIVIVIFLMTFEALSRYAFNAPTTWVYQIVWSFMSPYFLWAGAYALLKEAHIKMDVVYGSLSLRVRAILDLFTATLFYSFCGVLLGAGFEWACNSLAVLENSGPPLYYPTYPVKLGLPFGVFLLLLQGSAKFIRDFVTAITGKEYEC